MHRGDSAAGDRCGGHQLVFGHEYAYKHRERERASRKDQVVFLGVLSHHILQFGKVYDGSHVISLFSTARTPQDLNG
jgi:hypothetical protein